MAGATKLTITIPLPMPTWNRILQMHHWQRMRLRHLLHLFVSLSITHGRDWPTWTVFQSKPQSTALLKLEYLQLIRPNKSRKSAIANLKGAKKKRQS